MHVDGTPYRTVWWDSERDAVRIIDQRKLPFAFEIEELSTVASVAEAIRDMHVRGAAKVPDKRGTF